MNCRLQNLRTLKVKKTQQWWLVGTGGAIAVTGLALLGLGAFFLKDVKQHA